MAARQDIQAPEWLVPGAQVVVWEDGRSSYDSNPSARVVTVKSIGKMWLSLDGLDEKIRIDTLQSKDFGSRFTHWRYKIAERHSDLGSQMLIKTILGRRFDNAKSAARDFEKTRLHRKERVALRDAITTLQEALTALGDALALAEENGS